MYCAYHFIVYANVKSLYRTPEITDILHNFNFNEKCLKLQTLLK